MVFRSGREKRLWFAAGLCIVLIYSSLYVARPVANFLRDQNLLRLMVALAFLSTGGLVVWRLLVGGVGWRVMGTVSAIAAGYLLLLTSIPMMPEERLHFLEYGVVAALIYLALRERRVQFAASGTDSADILVRLQPFATALVLTGIFGWIDEGIQALLPNRFYDIRDVSFNAAAAFACLASLKLVEWARQHE